jgi:hypothetical protein
MRLSSVAAALRQEQQGFIFISTLARERAAAGCHLIEFGTRNTLPVPSLIMWTAR